MEGEVVTVLIVDDHLIAREGLRAMLESVGEIQIVGVAADGMEAVEKALELRPRVVLMDVRMPRLGGLKATEKLRILCPEISVILMTSFDDGPGVLEALRIGAAGYLLKDATTELLAHAILSVASGAMSIEATLMTRIVALLDSAARRTQPEQSSLPAGAAHLTIREREVLTLVADGRTNQEIGEMLVLARVTVKKHVQSIISKLEVTDRTQAAVTAIRCGLAP